MRPRPAARAPPPQPQTKPDIFSKNQASLTQAARRAGSVLCRPGPGPRAARGRGGVRPPLSPDRHHHPHPTPHPPPRGCCPGLLSSGPHTLGGACALLADPGQSPALREPPDLILVALTREI